MRIGTVVLFVFAAVFTIILPRVQALNTVDAVGTAARILADQFASDTDALNAVIGNMSASSLSSNQIVALCTAWPQSAILDDLFAMAKQNDGHGLTHADWWGLVYAKTPTVQTPENLESDLDYLLTENRHWHDVLNGAVLRRLHRDSEARRVVVEWLLNTDDPTVKVSIPRLLRAAGGLSEDAVQWCKTEFRAQLTAGNSPELGFDLSDGTVRAVPAALLSVLNG